MVNKYSYKQEIIQVNPYLIAIVLFIVLSYSVYLFLDDSTVANLGKEDHFFEYLTASLFLATSLIFLLLYLQKRKLTLAIFTLAMFVGAGEEISWGQRILNFETPEKLKTVNVQNEFNLHNIYIFNGTDLEDNMKQGLDRMLQIDFLFRIFILVFGIALPIGVYHFAPISELAQKLKIPVPPVTIGIFFLVNWLTFRILLSYILPTGKDYQYYDTIAELFECGSSYILFIVAIYFLRNRRQDFLGFDIKQLVSKT
ncbi:MAG: hypothetical protein HKN76_10890 [Saprospiraceae bacterium]|nr:hypothetical protein [Saprospiraceae bacterium]